MRTAGAVDYTVSSLGRRNSETFAALGATALQDNPAVLRGHSNEKAMRAAAATAVGLIRALHEAPSQVSLHTGETRIVMGRRQAVNVRPTDMDTRIARISALLTHRCEVRHGCGRFASFPRIP